MLDKVSLRVKFMGMFVVVMLVLFAANYAWRSHVLYAQAEHEMLETTQVLASEMDAVWDFMENSQDQFVKKSDGTYNLYCVVAAKAVSRLFTTNNERDFVIHYTNTETRKADDAPDEFELEALEVLKSDREAVAYWGIDTDSSGQKVFRYVEPLYASESCLECHGQPAGEIDQKGYAKEGLQLGDVAGAASIIMPMQTYERNIQSSLAQESAIFLLFIVAGLVVIFFGTSRLVLRPVRRLDEVAQQVERHDFNVNLDGVGDRDEIADLARRFTSMTQQLQQLYDHLEEEVNERTAQLASANRILEQQREELSSMNLRLEQENRYTSNFLAIMSHEIRTPLTSIVAFADIWSQSNTPRNEDEANIMREMQMNSQILLSMVNNILDMARVEAGRPDLLLEPVDVNDLLATVRQQMGFLAESRGVSIVVDADLDIPVVLIDEEKVRRILENLLSNAVKFTPYDGRILVRACWHADEEMLVFRVEDNGCGIAEEDVPNIFDRFVQSRGSGSRQSGGSGLGLALVRELTQIHGGDVVLERNACEGDEGVLAGRMEPGCTFRIRLHAAPYQMEEDI